MPSRFSLRAAALELPARWNEPALALADADALLSKSPALDLAVLPEASLTGYLSPRGDADLRALAQPLGGAHTRAVSALAKKHRAYVVAPLIERDGAGPAARFYNAMIAFDRDGAIVAHYRKRHPWYPETWATPGASPLPLFDVEGARVTVAICFDVHFLERESADALAAADVLLFPSAWVEDDGGVDDDARATLLPLLASRFEVAVVNANWGRGTPRIAGQGGSMIVSAGGVIVARAPHADTACRVDATLAHAPPATRQ